MPQQPHIVLIHGLYMRPLLMRPMARWFEGQGYSTSSFSYRTTSESLERNIEQLSAHLPALYLEKWRPTPRTWKPSGRAGVVARCAGLYRMAS